MSKRSRKTPSAGLQLSLLPADSPVRIYQWLDAARAWMESGQGYGSSIYELLQTISLDGLSLRMSPAFYPATQAMTRRVIYRREKNGKLSKRVISQSSFAGWSNSGIAS